MAETARIMTHTGKFVDLLHPEASLVDIEDIAHSLSRLNRFTGHTSAEYTVASHCMLASFIGLGDPLVCLLHDAAESYLGDLSSPLKRRTRISFGLGIPSIEFKTVESMHEAAIGEALGCPGIAHVVMGTSEKDADLVMGVAEAQILLGAGAKEPEWRPYFEDVLGLEEYVLIAAEALDRWLTRGMTQHAVKRAFLDRYEELKNAD